MNCPTCNLPLRYLSRAAICPSCKREIYGVKACGTCCFGTDGAPGFSRCVRTGETKDPNWSCGNWKEPSK